MKTAGKAACRNMMFADYPDIVDIAQMQNMLHISRHLAYELIQSGAVSGMKIGRSYRILKLSIIDYVLSNN